MAATDAKKVKAMRTSVGCFSSPSYALTYQCSKYVALHLVSRATLSTRPIGSLRASVLAVQLCLDSGMYVVIYIHSGFVTPSPADAVSHARTRTSARRPEPAAAPACTSPTEGLRVRTSQLAQAFSIALAVARSGAPRQGGVVLRQRAARLCRGHAGHLRLSRLCLLHQRSRHQALLPDRQLAYLPGGRGRSGR
eukprot:3971356-Pleurochrysis_carterae.AAC.1